MKIVRTALMLLVLLPWSFRSVSAQAIDTVTVVFQLRLDGDIPLDQVFVAFYVEPGSFESIQFEFCGQLQGSEPRQNCVGGGTVYTRTVELHAGKQYRITFGRYNEEISEDAQFFGQRTQTFITDATVTTTYDFDVAGVDAQPTEHIIRKTFNLTLLGDVPKGEILGVGVYDEDNPSNEPEELIFLCGSPPEESGIPDCVGSGTMYSRFTVKPKGTTIRYRVLRAAGNPDLSTIGPFQPVMEGTETLNADTTNAFHYDYTAGTGGTGHRPHGGLPGELPDSGGGGTADRAMPCGLLAGLFS